MNKYTTYKLSFSRKYAILAAVIISVIITIQTNVARDIPSLLLQLDTFVFFLINYLLWVFLLKWVYSSIQLKTSGYYNRITSFVGSLLLLGFILIVHLVVSNVMYFLAKLFYESTDLNQFWSVFTSYLYESMVRRIIDLVVIILILKFADAYQAIQINKLKVVELESQLSTAALETLKAQLNPHFLFNALHSLHYLIGQDDEKAKSMVIKISGLLRKILEQEVNQLIPLEDELSYLNDYLDLEKERFYDRLKVEFEVESNLEQILVPSLILQPLIENAFKHGISQIENEGIISIRINLLDSNLHIEMKNSIPDEKTANKFPSTGIGLQNLAKRLKTLNDSHQVEWSSSDGFFTIHIRLNNVQAA